MQMIIFVINVMQFVLNAPNQSAIVPVVQVQINWMQLIILVYLIVTLVFMKIIHQFLLNAFNAHQIARLALLLLYAQVVVQHIF